MRGKLAHLACRAIRLYDANGNGVYGTAVRTRITETVTETDTDERKRKAGNHASHGSVSVRL